MLLLLLCIWPQDSLQQMPPLDPANLLPLEAANSPDLDGSQGSTALNLMDRELGDQRSSEGKTGSLGLEENQIDKLEVEVGTEEGGNSELDEEQPWVDFSLNGGGVEEDGVNDDGGELEEEDKVKASEEGEGVSEEESGELDRDDDDEEEEQEEDAEGANGDGADEVSSEEKEKEDHSLRDLNKFPVIDLADLIVPRDPNRDSDYDYNLLNRS